MNLLDFGAVKVGGGVQQARLLLESAKDRLNLAETFFVRPPHGPIAELIPRISPNSIASHSNPLRRMVFESTLVPATVKRHAIKSIYTAFGPGLPRHVGVRQITNVAYPIICYPDSPYWTYVPMPDRLRALAANSVRIERIRRADIIIVETTVMKQRLSDFCSVPNDRIVVSPPISNVSIETGQARQLPNQVPIIAILSGLAAHKNLWRLPEILAELNHRRRPLRLHCSFARADFLEHLTRHRRVANLELIQQFMSFEGGVAPERVLDFLKPATALLTLSDLESVSNNYLEARAAGLPVVASDRDFARYACGDAAFYVDPHRAASVCDAIDMISEGAPLGPWPTASALSISAHGKWSHITSLLTQ